MQVLDVKTYKIERIVIDEEFSAQVQPLDPKELAQLEENIRRDGIREPLSIWMADGTTPTLLDGHNRRAIAETLGMAEVPVHYVKLPDRDSALLWIETNQIGRRNLTDDQRAMIWASILDRRAKASRSAQLEQARPVKAAPDTVEVEITPTEKTDSAADMAEALAPKERARAQVAKESGLSENKLRDAAQLKKEAPELAKEVRAGKKTLRQANKAAKAKNTLPLERLPETPMGRYHKLRTAVERIYDEVQRERELPEHWEKLQEYLCSGSSGVMANKAEARARFEAEGWKVLSSTAELIQCRQEALTWRRNAKEWWENTTNSYEDLVEKGAPAEVIDEAKLVMDDAEETASNADSAFLALDSALRRAGIVGLSKPAPVESVDATEPLIEVLP